jgi:hypothetical protein
VSLGGCHRAVLEAVERLAERGVAVDYLRVRAFPFAAEVEAFLRGHERVFVVEQNRDGSSRTCWRWRPASRGARWSRWAPSAGCRSAPATWWTASSPPWAPPRRARPAPEPEPLVPA